MAWEQRGKKRYYFRCRKVAGRVVREYVGSGPAAELAAAADALRRLEREIQSRERREEQAHLWEAEAPLLALCEATNVLTRAALVAAGYYQHDRGAWRRARRTEATP
jgi:hypothetical protein